MKRTLGTLALMLGMTGLLRAAPMTATTTREIALGAVESLVTINYALCDDYFHANEWEKAVAVLDRIIGLRPTDINAYANAAWLLWSSDQVDRAMVYYKKMIENNPTSADAYYTIGHYYFFTRRDYKEALPYLEKAVELGGPILQRHLHAHCLGKLGRTREALDAWQKILADNPDDAVSKREIEKLNAGQPAATEEPAADSSDK